MSISALVHPLVAIMALAQHLNAHGFGFEMSELELYGIAYALATVMTASTLFLGTLIKNFQ